MDGVKVDWQQVTVADMAALQEDTNSVARQAQFLSRLVQELPAGDPEDLATYDAMKLTDFQAVQEHAMQQKPAAKAATENQFDWDAVTVADFRNFQQAPGKIENQIGLLLAICSTGPDSLDAYMAMPLLEYEGLLQAAMDARATDAKK